MSRIRRSEPELCLLFYFLFSDTATTEIYTLSLHDALPIFIRPSSAVYCAMRSHAVAASSSDRNDSLASVASAVPSTRWRDRKSTRLNSSHSQISYAVFCLKKKKI